MPGNMLGNQHISYSIFKSRRWMNKPRSKCCRWSPRSAIKINIIKALHYSSEYKRTVLVLFAFAPRPAPPQMLHDPIAGTELLTHSTDQPINCNCHSFYKLSRTIRYKSICFILKHIPRPAHQSNQSWSRRPITLPHSLLKFAILVFPFTWFVQHGYLLPRCPYH